MSPLLTAKTHLTSSFGHVAFRVGQEDAIAATRDAIDGVAEVLRPSSTSFAKASEG